MKDAVSKFIAVAKTQLGKTEKPIGSNWGFPVKDYLASVGIKFPASWCMAFVYWCAKNSGLNSSLFKTGGVLQQWQKVDAKLKSKTPGDGAIFIMDLGHGLGHCGIVESFDTTYLYTIEGNTNDTGSREGFEVCRRKRPINNPAIIGYIKF